MFYTLIIIKIKKVMRNNKKYILVLLFSILIGSCTNLDMPLDGISADNYPENPNQEATQTVPIYTPLRDFLDYGCWWFAQEVTSDEMVCPQRKTDWYDKGKWLALHKHTWDNQTEAVNSMWSRYYQGIGECNRLLEVITDETAEKKIIRAQIITMRSFYYWLAIDNYGDVPYVINYVDAPAKPFKEHRDVIWQGVVNDLESVVDMVPSTSTRTLISKGMAYTLLAKLYLNAEVYTGKSENSYWVKAEEYCQKVIDEGIYSLEDNFLAPFVTENQNSSENIFTIPYDEDNYTGFNLHMRTLHYQSNLTFDMTVGPWNGFCAMEEHYNTFAIDDLRTEGYFMVGQQYDYEGEEIPDLIINPHIAALVLTASNTPAEVTMSGARIKKFEIKKGAKDNLSNDFPLFRYADVLLMMAEAQLRQGKVVSVPDLDRIRTRVGLDAGWSATLSGAAGLDELLAERGRELFWEGYRRQDLIRFGKFGNEWWEKSASTEDREVFPIPQWVLDINPNADDFEN